MKIKSPRRTVLATVPAGLTAFAGLLAFATGAAATPATATPATATAVASPASTSAPAPAGNSSAAPSSTPVATPTPAGATKTAATKTGAAKTGAAKTGAAKTGAAKTGAAKTGAAKTGVVKTGATKPGSSAAAAKAPAAGLHTTATLSTVNGKSASSATVIHAGDLLVYQIAVGNTGTAAGTVTLTETVPTHTTYAATKTVWNGCAKGARAGTKCTQTVTVPAGAKGTTTFTVQADNPLPGGATSIADSVRASSGSCTACTVRAATAANLHTRLAIASVNGHAASPSTHLSRGDHVVYTVVVSNNGGSTGTTTVHDTVPTNATFSGSGWTCHSGATAGSSCTRAVTVDPGSTATASYRVTLTSYPGDTKSVANAVSTSSGTCSACRVSNRTVAHLVTTKVIFRVGTGVVGSSASLRSGDRVVYHVTVTNTGGSTGSTTLSDTVPSHTTYVGQGQGWSCPRHSSAGTSCTQTVTVSSGANVVLRYTVLVGSSSGAAFSSVTNSVTTSEGTCSNCSVTNSVTQEGSLANTGIDTSAQSAIGVGLLGAGVLLTLAGRRRRTG